MTRAASIIERLQVLEQQVDTEQETEPEEDEEMEDDDPNPFSKENRNPDGSIKTKGRDPINDKKKKKT